MPAISDHAIRIIQVLVMFGLTVIVSLVGFMANKALEKLDTNTSTLVAVKTEVSGVKEAVKELQSKAFVTRQDLPALVHAIMREWEERLTRLEAWREGQGK